MTSTVINSLRVFKGLYELAFSEDQFYAEQRAEFLGGIQQCIEQVKEGSSTPPEAKVYVRKPFTVLLGVLILFFLLVVMFGAR